MLSEHTVTLEQLLASQRNIEQRVDLSTLTIDLTYVAPDSVAPVPEPEDDSLAGAFRTGWEAFTGVVMAGLFVLAVAAPFLAVAALVVGVAWIIGRSMSERRARRNVSTRRADESVGADTAEEVLVGSDRSV